MTIEIINEHTEIKLEPFLAVEQLTKTVLARNFKGKYLNPTRINDIFPCT